MKRILVLLIILVFPAQIFSQTLTVPQIMQDYKTWVGAWPSNPYWLADNETLYFSWNPQGTFLSDSLFKISKSNLNPTQVPVDERRDINISFNGWHHATKQFTNDFSQKVFTARGDLYVFNLKNKSIQQLTNTADGEANAFFAPDDKGIYFTRSTNYFYYDLDTKLITQLNQLSSGKENVLSTTSINTKDDFLSKQQEYLFDVVRTQNERQQIRKEAQERERAAQEKLPTFYANGKNIQNIQLNPTGRFVTFSLVKYADNTRTSVQDYVTNDGYAKNINARSKVGAKPNSYEFYIQDLKRDTTYSVDIKSLPNAERIPEFLQEQGIEELKGVYERTFMPYGPYWNKAGNMAIMEIRTYDNKDRWIVRLHPEEGTVTVLDYQHDEAWIAGPEIAWWGGSGTVGWLPDGKHAYFQSEASGYSHLYIVEVETGTIKQLTQGSFEVFSPQISKDGKKWFFTSSEGSPYERHFYEMPIYGGNRKRLTTNIGSNEVALSPDEKTMAILYSYSNKPPEIYLQNIGEKQPRRITNSPTDAWLAYDWRDPEIIEFPASDGAAVPARLYMPENPNGSAVFFVHGAGYLQNVHKWWSSYFREYMFHNLLTDKGYIVLDVDYRASSGYGRDWRTAIYRHMGGRDLQDFVDASKYVQKTYNIDPEKIAIYGGSYGGFITLMALFTAPEYFGAGAALRSVTDWAHYNHTYTANILNTPETDSLAIAQSSPIYFAEGLEDPLLICHGMVDTNVHFQDVVRLAQRLIELKKENWEMAVYPVEDHGFVEPSSWTDEYRRILKLIEENIGPNRKRE